MNSSFFFYDLETTGVNPRAGRIMQFAGQRTDMELKPVGEPVNVLIKLTPDILPEPDAVMVTGITPQQTVVEGLTEVEFLKFLHEEIAVPGTIFVGFNSVRFDDEFMRYLHYRNFYDAYEWQWKDGRGRWDLLDIVRMTRALRPEGINWPFAPDGTPSNRLEYLTSVNHLEHADAHDALSDVLALAELARLIHKKQPKLFKFLFDMRDKKKAAALVRTGNPFMYSSGRYPSEYEKTTAAIMLAEHPTKQGALVYDLRQDPTEFIKMTPEQLAERWKFTKDEKAPKRLPIKTLQFNRCPAIAPAGVLDKDSEIRLKLTNQLVDGHLRKLQAAEDFPDKVLQALAMLDKQRQAELLGDERHVDSQLYDGFFDEHDKKAMSVVRAADPEELNTLNLKFHDQRLSLLLPLYKARNYPGSLNPDERAEWDKFCHDKLFAGENSSRLAKYFKWIDEIAQRKGITEDQKFLLEELRLYGESIMPVFEGA